MSVVLAAGARVGDELRRYGAVVPLETLDAIHSRYACRSFSDRAPAEPELAAIAEAAVAAPSGMNLQRWHVIGVTDKQLIHDLEAAGIANLAAAADRSGYDRIMARGGKLFYNAPVIFIVTVPKTEPGSSETTSIALDCGIVAENIALAATSLGIDNVICGMIRIAFDGAQGDEFRQRLGFPDGYGLGVSVLLGYATEPGGKPHKPDLTKISYV